MATVATGVQQERKADEIALITGSEAIAVACKLADVDVITAYPIRPYDTVMQYVAKLIANGELLEWATFAGNRYGTLRSDLEHRLAQGAGVVLEIEVQGTRQVRAAMPDAVAVFIAPPSREALRARLGGRGTDSSEQVDARLKTAENELEAQPEFAHVVVNDRLEQATDELVSIVRAAMDR